MSVFVDANVIIYAANPSPSYDQARLFMGAFMDGGLEGVTSTAVLEEVWHAESRDRLTGLRGATRDAYELLEPLLPVTDAVFRRALDLDAARLGTNDRVHVATCLEHGIDTIVTADADFDDVSGLRRIDPLAPGALERLRAAP